MRYNSSSSSAAVDFSFDSAGMAGTAGTAGIVLGAEVDMTEPRAALRLCVLEYLSPSVAAVSTLARAFLRGLPTIASAEMLSTA